MKNFIKWTQTNELNHIQHSTRGFGSIISATEFEMKNLIHRLSDALIVRFEYNNVV